MTIRILILIAILIQLTAQTISASKLTQTVNVYVESGVYLTDRQIRAAFDEAEKDWGTDYQLTIIHNVKPPRFTDSLAYVRHYRTKRSADITAVLVNQISTGEMSGYADEFYQTIIIDASDINTGIRLVSHELGHLLGHEHTTHGLMSASERLRNESY